MIVKTVVRRLFAVLWLVSCAAFGDAARPFITLASTTSTQNSGLYDALLPAFTAVSGIDVRVVAVGTGKAIKLAENGDADVLLVHHRESEDRFVREGFGIVRYDLMYNYFVLAGPAPDPAGVDGLDSITAALARIADTRSLFVSRGDESGTHRKERQLWKGTGLLPDSAVVDWYRETGSGMGATLNVASAINAYALTDRATWLRFLNKAKLKILVEGDPSLFNQYGLIRVNEKRHPHVKSELAQTFVDWLLSVEGQSAINRYTINGERAFYANAVK